MLNHVNLSVSFSLCVCLYVVSVCFIIFHFHIASGIRAILRSTRDIRALGLLGGLSVLSMPGCSCDWMF